MDDAVRVREPAELAAVRRMLQRADFAGSEGCPFPEEVGAVQDAMQELAQGFRAVPNPTVALQILATFVWGLSMARLRTIDDVVAMAERFDSVRGAVDDTDFEEAAERVGLLLVALLEAIRLRAPEEIR